jgi:5-methyltetrahydropteroyltriglutamate--homocysteine methyltransferase
VDDAWLPALWDRIGIEMGRAAFKKRCEMRVEALNHALAGIPEDRISYHLCWGSWQGPHAFDIEMRDLVDVML